MFNGFELIYLVLKTAVTIAPVFDYIERVNSILKLLYGYRREKMSF